METQKGSNCYLQNRSADQLHMVREHQMVRSNRILKERKSINPTKCGK